MNISELTTLQHLQDIVNTKTRSLEMAARLKVVFDEVIEQAEISGIKISLAIQRIVQEHIRHELIKHTY
jgi:hypothetical protein